MALIVVGVVVGVLVSKSHSSSSNNNNNSLASTNTTAGPTSNSTNTTTTSQTNATVDDGIDYSVFEKDPNLHQSFYGIAYTPKDSQVPACGNKLGT